MESTASDTDRHVLSEVRRLSDEIAVRDSAGAAIAGLERSPVTAAVALDAIQAFSQGARSAAWTAAGHPWDGLLASLSLGRSTERIFLGRAIDQARAGSHVSAADSSSLANPSLVDQRCSNRSLRHNHHLGRLASNGQATVSGTVACASAPAEREF